MKNVRFLMMLVGALGVCAVTAPARADDGSAQSFVQSEHSKLETLLKQPASASRDSQVNHELESMVDYDELAKRAFGQPCPAEVAQCTNHWNELTDPQKAEVTGLLKQLVEKNYRKNLIKTLDYDITYTGAKEVGDDTQVRTEAKSKINVRDPAVQVNYLVHGTGAQRKVVNIVTEGSSLVKNYYNQFHRMLTTPGQGYAYVVKKLNENIAKKT